MTKRPLDGARILVIGIGFYDYETVIATELRRLGAEVLSEIESAPEARDRFAPLRSRIAPVKAADHARHHERILERVRRFGQIDHVVVINGRLLSETFLTTLRALQPQAKFTTYLWDSLSRFPDLADRLDLFDRALTFDPADAAAVPGLLFRPTFYRPELLAAPPAPPVDLCFVGWLHHDRMKQVESLRAQADALGLRAFFYLYTGFATGLRMLAQRRNRDVYLRTLPFERYAGQVVATRILIDLPHPMQTGLTMRAADAVGAGCKLLTTARGVTAYDFYRPENVAVIDAAAPVLDPSFLAVPPVALPPETTTRYSLEEWVLDILGVTEPSGFLANERGST
jgi:hypothetical protein